jgi:chromosome segregation ATPase
LIKGLIEKLEKEAAEAADTHAFCEEEKKKNADATDKTQATLDKLDARLDKAQAKTAELNERITELSDEIAAIDESIAEATKIRQEEKATFTKANADFKEAADAVSDAIDVLKDFYEGGGAFIQISAVTAHKDDPWKRMFGTSLRAAEDQPEEVVGVDPSEAGAGVGDVAIPKMGGPSAAKGGIIIGMMETMAGEFSKTVAELGATEDKAQKEYDEMMQDNKVSKTSKEMEIKGSKQELSMLDVRIGESTEDHKLATKEMAAINAYILKLKPTCEGRVVSFEERQAKREAEIAGCKEALQILDDTTDSIGLLQVRSLRRNLRSH